jgi:hypothetical protein
MKEIENRKRKRRKEGKKQKRAKGKRFGPEQKSAHGPNSLTRSGIFSSLSLADMWAQLVRPHHHLLHPAKIPRVTSGRSDSGHAINLTDSLPNSTFRPRLFNPLHPLSDSPLLPPSEAPSG